MITFTYKLTSYLSFVEEFAQLIGVPLTGHELQLPEQLGEGFMKAISFDGVSVLLYNATLKEDLLFKREKDTTEFYTLNFEDVANLQGVQIRIEKDELVTRAQRSVFLYLTSFLYDMDILLHKGVNLKGMRIYLPAAWLRKYLCIDQKEDVLERYINLKTAGIWYKSIDPESKELFDEIINNKNLPLLSYQNKALRLVEKFFDWLYNEMQLLPHQKTISRSDILTARQIATLLTNDVTIIPPTIRELSRQFAMSESKLKKVFKTVFGLPPYEYFQKFRMQKARQMLLSGNYAIKDVGYTLGYSNLSNFTLAFKKEFGKLPSEVVKEAK